MVKKNTIRGFSLPLLLLTAIMASCLFGIFNQPPENSQVLGTKSSQNLSQVFTRIKRTITWKTFKSEQYGYLLRHPRKWKVEDKSTDHSRGVVVTEPNGLAMVTIGSYKDDRLKEEGMLAVALEAKEKEMRSDPNYQVSNFAKRVEGNIGAYLATGRTNFDNFPLVFLEKGLYENSNKMLFMHGAIVPEHFKEFQTDVEGIMESFKVK